MASSQGILSELQSFNLKVARVASLEFQGDMKKMSPVDTGNLRANVQWQELDDNKGFRVFNNQVYAQRIYLEGHSQQLPTGDFQAKVSAIPQRMEAITRGLSNGS